MTPYYLTPDLNCPPEMENELLFHKRNIYLLALTFDHILICTDNIAAFTRFTTQDIVYRVIRSEWFRKFLEAGIIVLCGWGSDYGSDLMENQIDYSLRYRPELKPPALLAQLRGLAHNGEIVLRESAYGERDHITFLRDKVRHMEGPLTLDEVSSLMELIEETQIKHGYVGTMEIFPVIDRGLLVDPTKANAFYRSYYQSWQEYSTGYYAPAITVDSSRIRLPDRQTTLKHFASRDAQVLSSLYSPDFFHKFLSSKLGAKTVVNLLDARPERVIAIRNGDWKVFLNRYHDCLESASELGWIIAEARRMNLLSDDKRVGELVDHIFDVLDPNTDFASVANLLDAVLKVTVGVAFFGVVFSLLKKRITKRILALANRGKYGEFEPFLQKLERLLTQPRPRERLITP